MPTPVEEGLPGVDEGQEQGVGGYLLNVVIGGTRFEPPTMEEHD